MSTSTGYFTGVQALRFVAAFLVLIAHSTLAVHERIPSAGITVWTDGAVGVKIFFVISGFVMVVTGYSLVGQPNGYFKFIERRLIRIVPLYWMATTMKLAILLIVPSVALHSELDWFHVLSSYLFVPHLNAEGEFRPLHALGWTLNYEMAFYVSFAVALLLRVRPLVFVGLLFGAAFGLGFAFELPRESVLSFYASGLILLFVAGMGLGEVVLLRRNVPPMIGVILFLVSVANFVAVSFDDGALTRWLYYSGCSAVLLVAGVVFLEPLIAQRLPKWCVHLGDSSYSLYLLHPFVVVSVGLLAAKLGVTDGPLALLTMISASIVLGILGFQLLEAPATAWLRVRAEQQRE